MDINKRQAEFWATLIIICTVVAIAVLLLDFGIKAAILEESTRLRLKIEEWEIGRKHQETNASGVGDDATVNSPIPGSLLVEHSPGMEAGNATEGATATATASDNGRPKSGRTSRNRKISDGDK